MKAHNKGKGHYLMRTRGWIYPAQGRNLVGGERSGEGKYMCLCKAGGGYDPSRRDAPRRPPFGYDLSKLKLNGRLTF